MSEISDYSVPTKGGDLVRKARQEASECLANAYRLGRTEALAAAAAAIRAFDVEMRLTVLPEAHNGQVVVRDLREELAKLVEGVG